MVCETAPEFIFVKRYDYISDMFTLGCTIYETYTGRKLLSCSNNVLTYKHAIESLAAADYSGLPDDLLRTQRTLAFIRSMRVYRSLAWFSILALDSKRSAALRGLVTVDPRRRMGIRDFLQSAYYNDINIRSIAFLGTLMEKDESTKASFFKGFLTLLPNFTPRIIQQKVIPPLMIELKNLTMAPFVLPLLFDMTKHMTQKQFSTIVFPHVRSESPSLSSHLPSFLRMLARTCRLIPYHTTQLLPLFQQRDNFRILVILMENLELLLPKIAHDHVVDAILPMVCELLDTPTANVQDMVVRQIPKIASMFEYTLFKQALLPRLVKLLIEPSPVRMNAVICMSKVRCSLSLPLAICHCLVSLARYRLATHRYRCHFLSRYSTLSKRS